MAGHLSIGYVAWQNLGRRPFRSAIAGLVVTLTIGVLFGSVLLIAGLSGGLDSAKGRLGADLLVVPAGYEAPVQVALLRGEPNMFYVDRAVMDGVAAAPGIAALSPQLYVSTLSAGCCSAPVQVIAFDPASDFTVTPWIKGRLHHPLEPDEIVVGSLFVAQPGEELRFYGQTYRVAAMLDETGTGIDRSVFMTFDTAYRMAEGSLTLAEQPLEIPQGAISTVLVRLLPGYDPREVADSIQFHTPGVTVLRANDIVKQVSRQLESLGTILGAVTALLWIISGAVLLGTFSMVVDERRRELGLLRTMGATRGHLASLVLFEASTLTALGTAAGILSAAVLLYAFKGLLAAASGMPQLFPHLGTLTALALGCAAVGILLGPLAGLYPAWRAGSAEPYVAIREAA